MKMAVLTISQPSSCVYKRLVKRLRRCDTRYGLGVAKRARIQLYWGCFRARLLVSRRVMAKGVLPALLYVLAVALWPLLPTLLQSHNLLSEDRDVDGAGFFICRLHCSPCSFLQVLAQAPYSFYE